MITPTKRVAAKRTTDARTATRAKAPRTKRTSKNEIASEAGAAPGPRYLQIARELTAAIASGQYPIGARLPTELELCEQFHISRFTAREAVRVLSSAGLITRRQRVGTVVIATPADARYTHAVSSVGDLFQYAQDTELRLMFIGKVALAQEKARQFGATPGEEGVYAFGLRHSGRVNEGSDPEQVGRPICLTRLYLSPELNGIEAKLRDRKTAVYAIIEREYGVQIHRVEQDLQSVALDADDAANLGALPGSQALMIVRRYFDERDRLMEVAENIHPGDRFTYRMELRK